MLFTPALDNQRRMYLFDFFKTQMNIPVREEQRRDFVACFLVNFRSFYQEETSMRFQISVFYSDVSLIKMDAIEGYPKERRKKKREKTNYGSPQAA